MLQSVKKLLRIREVFHAISRCHQVKVVLMATGVISLSGCSAEQAMFPGDSTLSVMQDFFAAEAQFDKHNYAAAESLLEKAYAVLKTRPAAERPDNPLVPHVNVHNYSIMTLELLSKCKYALGKLSQIQPLIEAEEPLLNGGYSGSYSKVPTTGARLYLTGFSAAMKLHARDAKAADSLLAQCEPLQNLSTTSAYAWLGDKGSPDFGRYLWLNTKEQVLQKLGNKAEAAAYQRELPSLRFRLGIGLTN